VVVFSQDAAGGESALRALGAAYGYTNCFTHILKDYCSQQDSESESDSDSDPDVAANSGVCTEYDMTGSNEFRYETIGAHLQSVTARMSFSHQSAREVFFGEGKRDETYSQALTVGVHLMSRLRYALNV
jgi:hypothetical protein